MRAQTTAGRRKAALVALAVRIGWVLAVVFVAWAAAPKDVPEKVNVEDLCGAAKYQAHEQLARQ